jgi:hypothetical protein
VLRYRLLADVSSIIDKTDGLQVLTDNRVGKAALADRAAAEGLLGESPEKDQALVRVKHAELASRDVAGGFWAAAADPSIVDHALTREIPLPHVHQAALPSDGAARAVDP